MNFAPWQTDFNLKCLFFFSTKFCYIGYTKEQKQLENGKTSSHIFSKNVVF